MATCGNHRNMFGNLWQCSEVVATSSVMLDVGNFGEIWILWIQKSHTFDLHVGKVGRYRFAMQNFRGTPLINVNFAL